MVNQNLNRRILLAGLAASTLVPNVAHAEDYIDLDWEDLLPQDQSTIPNALRGLLPHDEGLSLTRQQPASSGVRTDWNGQIVRLPGFIVPIDYKGTGVTAFILVPYVGACVHTHHHRLQTNLSLSPRTSRMRVVGYSNRLTLLACLAYHP